MYLTRATSTTDEKLQDELFKKARAAVTAAINLDPDDPTVQLAAPRVLMVEPKSGPAKALAMLDGMIASNAKKGKPETLPYRKLRIEILFALRDEQLTSQLHAATEDMKDWKKEDQADVWAQVAACFDALGQYPDAELCYKEATRLAPTSLPYRAALFELARKQGNDDAMQTAQKGLLEILKDPKSPDYVITEVKRQIVAFVTGAITKDELKKARTMLNEAIKTRPTWSELYVLSGQLFLILEEDQTRALDAFNKANETGPANLGAIGIQVRLLEEAGRFADARKMMDRLPEAQWVAILNRSAANVLRNVNEPDKAYAEAKKLADANPNDAAVQVWFADIAVQAEEFKTAEAAYKKALAINSSVPDYWSSLLNLYMVQKRAADVESTLRQAQLALEDEYLTLLTAQQHRLFSRFPQAESIFLSAYGDRFDEPGVAQRMAEFYLGWAERDASYRGKAARYLNRILHAANEGKLPQTDPIALWARRQAARFLASTGDYQDSLKAERLLASAMENNASTQESEDLLIDILNRRGDPASRKRMASLLRKIQKRRPLSPSGELLLGQTLFDVAEWSECDRQMQDAITRYPNDLALRVGQVEMFINRKDAVSAERALTRMANLEGADKAIPQLRVRLAAAKGDKVQVRKLLTALTPDLRGLKENQLPQLHAVAILADSVGDHEYALQLIQEFVRRAPASDAEAAQFELAQFTAMYGDVEDGLNRLQKMFPNNIDRVLSTVIEVLRSRRAEFPGKIDPVVDHLVQRARQEDPEAARRMVLEAESLEIEERFPEAIAAYTKLLERDDVPKFVRASALNNRSFLLAMTKQDLDLAIEGVNQAMDIMGPVSDILDTRGLVYLHRGEFGPAVADLKLAVMMNATASKFFHLAEALLGAGDEAGALSAWKRAEDMGLTVEKTPTVERGDLEQMKKKIQGIKAKNGSA